MQARSSSLRSSQSTLLMEDVPSKPASYNEYVQRRLSESVRKAYTRGFKRGCQRQLYALCLGAIFGCLFGFYLAVSGQSHQAHASPADRAGNAAASEWSRSGR